MAITPRQMLVSPSKYSVKCPYSMKAEAITVHNTANDASANNEISYMINNNNQVSYHFAVDDKEVVQGIPLDRNAWHAGDGGSGYGNRKTIGIEICYSKSGGSRFDAAERLAAKFIAQLLKERGWGIDKVGTHQQRSGKYCPHRTLDYGWQRFLDMVRAELNPKVNWVDNPYPTMITNKATNLYALPARTVVKSFAKGEIIEGLCQYTFVDNVPYLRTDWSKANNKDNGFPEADLSKYNPEPPKPIIIWLNTAETTMLVKDGGANLVNVETGAVIKALPAGEEFTYVQQTSDGKYVRTDYSRDKGINNGVLLSSLVTKPEPTPEPVPEPEPAPEPAPEPTPTPDPDDKVPNWFVKFINDLINFLFGWIGKGKE